MSNARDLARVDLSDQDAPILMNGQFDQWQRGPTRSGLVSGSVGPDRWQFVRDGSGAVVNATRVDWSLAHPSNTWGGKHLADFQCTSAGSGETYHNWRYKDEKVDRMAGKTFTLTLVIRSITGDMYLDAIRAVQYFGTGGSPSAQVSSDIATNVFVPTSGFTTITQTFTVPSVSGKTLGTDGNDFTSIAIDPGLNTTYHLRVAAIQIDEGKVAKPIRRVDVTADLNRCKRYYEKSYAHDDAPGTATNNNRDITENANGNAYILETARFTVQKRAVPTISVYSPNSGAVGNVYNYNSASDIAVSNLVSTGTERMGRIQVGTAATSGQWFGWHWVADAEL